MRMIKLRSVHSTHSLWKNWRVLATYMRRMRYNNLEIRIAGSSCRPQLISFFYFFSDNCSLSVNLSNSWTILSFFSPALNPLILFILKSVQNQIAEYWKTGEKIMIIKKYSKRMSQSVVLLIRNKVKSRSFLLFSLLFFVCLFVCLLYTSIIRTKSVQSTNKNKYSKE